MSKKLAVGHGIRPWLTDSGSLLTFQVVATVAGTFTFLLIARSLGVRDFGAFAAILGIAQAASLFLDAGLGAFLLRELSQTLGEQSDVGGHLVPVALLIELRMIAAFVPLIAVVSYFVSGKAELALLSIVLVVYVGLLALATSIETRFRAQRQIGRVGIASLVEKLSALTLMVIVLVADTGGILLVGVVLLSSAAVRLGVDVCVLSSPASLRRTTPSSMREDARLLKRASPFVATSVIFVLIPRLAVVAVAIVSTTAAAYFAVGERLVNAAVVYSASLSETLYPHISNGALHVRRALAIQFGVGAIGSVLIVLLARPFLQIAFGTADPVSVRTVRIMALSIPFTFLAGGFIVQAYSLGLEVRTSVFSLVATLIGMLAIVVGATRWGAAGAAAGFVVRQVLVCGSLGLLIVRHNSTCGERPAPGGQPT